MDYIESKYEEYLNAESRVQRQPMRDNRVHVCLYFIQPSGHGLKPLDIEFMKRLHDKVNIIPVLAKADTMTPDECTYFKKQVRPLSFTFPPMESGSSAVVVLINNSASFSSSLFSSLLLIPSHWETENRFSMKLLSTRLRFTNSPMSTTRNCANPNALSEIEYPLPSSGPTLLSKSTAGRFADDAIPGASLKV